jgi:hypothetical protein
LSDCRSAASINRNRHFPNRHFPKGLTVGIGLITATAMPSIDRASIAHNIEIAGDVAGLWHVEPNHDPTAGVPSRVWVALSQRGGEPLPLDLVSCGLTVFGQPRAEPIARPALTPTVQDSQQVPTAIVTFPATGAYKLELACQPKPGGSIAAFNMSYDVTVARSQVVPATPTASTPKASTLKASTPVPTATAANLPAPANHNLAFLGLGAIGLVGLVALLRWGIGRRGE